MQTEFEAKSLKINKDAIREKLKKLGAEKVFSESMFTRMTFESAELKSRGGWIRLRDEGDNLEKNRNLKIQCSF